MTAPRNLCPTCEGAGVVVAETSGEPFSLGSIDRQVCPECGGFGSRPTIPLRRSDSGSSKVQS